MIGADGADDNTPFLTNLTDDPATTGTIKIYLTPGKTLTMGRFDAESEQDFKVDGLGVTAEHCVFKHPEDTPGVVQLTSMIDALTYINGQKTEDNVEVALADGDRVVLGTCAQLFCFMHPSQRKERAAAEAVRGQRAEAPQAARAHVLLPSDRIGLPRHAHLRGADHRGRVALRDDGNAWAPRPAHHQR